ncbi:uncharacterized protein LODBEIA_P13940 [Lodderomyces beijingensis]|uniref:Uncharacterized protein n=1 Tax=Lodderomyces beijingensis TaxID=1775926 RepID=A0ABP0ZLL3_9ASCO
MPKEKKKRYQISELVNMRHNFRHNIILTDLLPQQSQSHPPAILYPISAFVALSPPMVNLSLSPSPNQNPNQLHSPNQRQQAPNNNLKRSSFINSPPPSSITPSAHPSIQQLEANSSFQQTRIIPIIQIEKGQAIPSGGMPIELLYRQYPSAKCFSSPISIEKSDFAGIEDLGDGLKEEGGDEQHEEDKEENEQESQASSPMLTSSSSEIIIKILPTNNSDTVASNRC